MKRYINLLITLVLLSFTAYAQNEITLTAIASSDELDLTEATLVTIPTQGPFMLVGNAIHSLTEDNETSAITFPEGMFIEDLVWTGEDFILKSRHEIYMLNDIETPAFVFEEEDFKIFPWDEQRIFIVNHDKGKDNVFLGNLKHKRVKRLVSFNEKIVYITPIGEATMIVTTENIYLFTDTECIRYLSFWSPVHTAVMTTKGLFFATNKEICILKGMDNFLLLFDTSCQQLLFDGKDLFILTDDYDVLKCTIEKLEL